MKKCAGKRKIFVEPEKKLKKTSRDSGFFFIQHIDLTEKKRRGRNLLTLICEKSSFSFDFRLRFHYFSAFFCG